MPYTVKRMSDSVKYRSSGFLAKLSYFVGKEEERKKSQEITFKKFNLDRQLGLSKLNRILESEFGKSYSEKNGMWSEHLLFFAALSLNPIKIDRILEIGTHKGETTRILHLLFPLSKITTMDLPPALAKELDIYSYGESNEIIEARKQNIGGINEIYEVQRDSCNLTIEENKYDLIWLDGAHGHPVCCVDITNAVRLIEHEGFIVCDDVYTTLRNSDSFYDSKATLQVLEAFKKSHLIDFSLINKRLSARSNIYKSQSKKIAVVQRFVV
jgi:predicted O-methyltransferase YrrM